MIKLKNIRVSYDKEVGESEALCGVNLEIDKGEFLTITGKSGCGKTTLLKVLCAIKKPDSGEYFYNGTNILSLKEKELCRFRNKSIGFIAQHFALIDKMTVYDNVELPLKYRRIRHAERRERVFDALKVIGIEQAVNKFPHQLSGGEKQRCAIARVLAQDADVILADEPTGSLDEKNTRNIVTVMKRLNSSGRTIVLVTHDKDVAMAGTRNINMRDGRIMI